MKQFFQEPTQAEWAQQQLEEEAFVTSAQAQQQADIDDYWATEAGNDALVEQHEAEAHYQGH